MKLKNVLNIVFRTNGAKDLILVTAHAILKISKWMQRKQTYYQIP